MTASPLPKVGEAFFSPDAKYLIVIPPGFSPSKASVGSKGDTEAFVFCDTTGTGTYKRMKSIRVYGQGMTMHTMNWSFDNRFLAVCTTDWSKPDQADSQLFVGKGEDFEKTQSFEGLSIAAACFSSDGKRMFTASAPETSKAKGVNNISSSTSVSRVSVWSIDQREKQPQFTALQVDLPENYPKPFSLSCSRDGKYVVATAWSSPAILVNPADRSTRPFIISDGSSIMRVTFYPGSEPDLSDLMMVASNGKVMFSKVSDLNKQDRIPGLDGVNHLLGSSWCEPLVFQGMGIPAFTNDGKHIVLISGGSFRFFETARVFEFPVHQRKTDKAEWVSSAGAADWLLELATVLTGSGRLLEGETKTGAYSVRDVFQNRLRPNVDDALGVAIWNKFTESWTVRGRSTERNSHK